MTTKKRRGRPKTYADGGAMLYVRLATKAQAERVRKLAKARGLTMSSLTRLALTEFLERN